MHRVEVEVEDDDLAPKLHYLVNRAEQPVTPRTTLHYAVRGTGPYRLEEEGDPLATVDTPDDVLYLIYYRCHARLLDHLGLAGWAALHGGIVGVGGRRVLVVGDKGAGKTTLLLRLLHDGHRVEGDEMVFVRDRAAVCLPRNFHVKDGTRALVPELGDASWDRLPTTAMTGGAVVTAFDPAAAGFAWRLDAGPIDLAVVLRPDHGGPASCRPLGSIELGRALLPRTFPSPISSAALLRACAGLVEGVDGYELTVGGLRQTADLLVAVVRDAGDARC